MGELVRLTKGEAEAIRLSGAMRDGRDGVSVKDVSVDHDGVMRIALTNGEMHAFRLELPADGKDGRDGAKGIQGDVGKQGPAGENGERGADGIDGKSGARGERGEVGKRGKDGQRGTKGLPGVDGFTPQIEFRTTDNAFQVRIQYQPGQWTEWEDALDVYHLAQVIAQFMPVPAFGGGGGGVTLNLKVEDDDVQIAQNVSTINFGDGLDVTDDGSGKVTVDATGGGLATVETDNTIEGDGSLAAPLHLYGIVNSLIVDAVTVQDNQVMVNAEITIESGNGGSLDIDPGGQLILLQTVA